MTDVFQIIGVAPSGFRYAWLDLPHRGWADVEFLPNGWERVPKSRHPEMGHPGREFIEVEGMTLCEQSVESEQSKLGLDWDAAAEVANEFADSFDIHMLALGLEPADAA